MFGEPVTSYSIKGSYRYGDLTISASWLYSLNWMASIVGYILSLLRRRLDMQVAVFIEINDIAESAEQSTQKYGIAFAI